MTSAEQLPVPVPEVQSPGAPNYDENARCRTFERDNSDISFDNLQVYHAKALCGRCAVKSACLVYELINETTDAVRGGLATNERQQLRPAYLAKVARTAANASAKSSASARDSVEDS
jgi:WhiB family redox-sensing transcriptional regulator